MSNHKKWRRPTTLGNFSVGNRHNTLVLSPFYQACLFLIAASPCVLDTPPTAPLSIFILSEEQGFSDHGQWALRLPFSELQRPSTTAQADFEPSVWPLLSTAMPLLCLWCSRHLAFAGLPFTRSYPVLPAGPWDLQSPPWLNEVPCYILVGPTVSHRALPWPTQCLDNDWHVT